MEMVPPNCDSCGPDRGHYDRAVAGGPLTLPIVDFRLPIGFWRDSPIGIWQVAIGNVKGHELNGFNRG